MKWLLALACMMVVMLGPAAGLAGSLPNFSGSWEFDRARSTVPSKLGSLFLQADMTLIIDHQPPVLRIERRARVHGMERSQILTYYTDGRETSNLTPRGDVILSKARWEHSALVIDLRGTLERDGKRQSMEGQDIMRLSDDGRTLVLEGTRRRNEEALQNARLVFTKK